MPYEKPYRAAAIKGGGEAYIGAVEG